MIKKDLRIGVREFQRNLTKLTKEIEKGQEFTVTNHAKILFKVIPYQDSSKKKNPKLDWIDKLAFKAEADLSQNVDEFLY